MHAVIGHRIPWLPSQTSTTLWRGFAEGARHFENVFAVQIGFGRFCARLFSINARPQIELVCQLSFRFHVVILSFEQRKRKRRLPKSLIVYELSNRQRANLQIARVV